MIEVVGIVIKKNGRVYYFSPEGFTFTLGSMVVVNTEKGLQLGQVVALPHKKRKEDLVLPLKKIIRLALPKDLKQYQKNVLEAEKALLNGRELAKQLNLSMRFIDAQFTLDRNQLLFHFVADERIDFRELAKRLAQLYKTRIELRQIGVRDKAKEVGGLGPCGRFLCCNTFLTDFNSVSINMAKNQFLSLNPTKINGVCGRLLCCLNYEDEMYTELKKGLPSLGMLCETPEGLGKVTSVDVFHRTYKVDVKGKGIVEMEEEK